MKFNWGTGILIFIILFIILAVSFMVFALRQNNDLVEDDYYEKGAGYSSQMVINKRSAIFADSISLQTNIANVELKVSNSILGTTDTIEAYFFRPSSKKEDFHTSLSTNRPMEVSNKNLTQGRYLVKLSWKKNQDSYMIEKEIFVK